MGTARKDVGWSPHLTNHGARELESVADHKARRYAGLVTQTAHWMVGQLPGMDTDEVALVHMD